MGKRKAIGVMLAQAEEQYQTQILSGVIERAFELDYDCMIFTVPIKGKVNEKIYNGAFNIFNLINFDRLDAVIIAPDTLAVSEMADAAVSLVKERFSGPVITVDLKCGDIPCMMSDDTGSIEAICDHMIEKHGCRVLDFMSGVPGHPHSARRLEGYKRSLEKHGIAFDERRVHDGDFWYDKGEAVADEILSSGLELPQAVICASDTMAISLCDALKKRGIDVPDKISVTGYDCIPEGRNHAPSITSAEIPAKQTGINAVEYLRSRLENIPYVTPEYELLVLPAQSCGCNLDASANFRSKNFSYTDSNYQTAFFSTENLMMNSLISSDNTEQLLYNIDWYTYQIKPFSDFYLCLSDDWKSLDSDDSTVYRRTGYHERIHLCIWRNGGGAARILDEVFDRSHMLPDIDSEREKPAAYYFSPLYFNDRCFGYTALKFEEPRSITLDYRSWLGYVCNGFECMRRQLHIKMMYKKLKSAALTDSLTGLYNRNAFNDFVEKLTDRSEQDPTAAMFMMADLNFLKTINDTYGHLAGDEALRTVARALRSVCGENERCYRFGGDEFIIIGMGEYTQRELDNMTYGIQKYLADYNENSHYPFRVMASLGAVCSEITADSDIDKIIRTADKIMYENKQRSKVDAPTPFNV